MRNQLLAVALGSFVALASVGADAQVNPFARSGFELTPQDVELVKAAAQKLYLGETAAVGTVETWSNEKSGSGGTVELVGTFSYKGLPCRRLQHDITVAKVADPFRFIIDRCKLPSGEWKIL